MKRRPQAIYQTPDEIDARIKAREADAAAAIPGAERQSILIEVAQLRAYASMKRWINAPPVTPKEEQYARPKQ